MQSDSGLSRWLKVPLLYNVFQAAVAGKFRGRDGDANVIKFISRRVWSIERNADHCSVAGLFARITDRYGSKGTFVVGDTHSLRGDLRFKNADIVTAVSVLHHLDDEDAADCIQFAYDALKNGGRFVSHDPCWVPNHGAFSKYIMSHDRGRNIRTEQQYRELAEKVFRNVKASVDTKPMRIPYVTVVLECEK